MAVGPPILSLLEIRPPSRYLELRKELDVGLRVAPFIMFAVENHAQDMWLGDDVQGGSIVSSASAPSRSEFDNFTAENGAGKKIARSSASSLSNGKASNRTPGVMRTGDLLMRNGPYILPHEKAQLRLDENVNGPTKTLFIDRDPDTFADICRHLQGTVIKRRFWNISLM